MEVNSVRDDHMLEAIKRAIETEEPILLEQYNEGLDRWLSVELFPLGGSRFVELFNDITEKKREEEEIARLVSFPKLNPNPVAEFDTDGHLVYANQAAESFFPDIRTLGMSHPFFSGWERILEEFSEENENRLTREVRVGNAWFQQQFNFFPELKRARIYSFEITKHKQAEMALKESEERYRHLVKYAPAGIYEVDFVNKRLKSVNDAMCQILGYSEEELLAMSPFDILDEESKSKFAERVKKAVAGEVIEEAVEYKVITKDGRELWASLNVSFTYERGKVTGALVVAHDVTERKNAEEALRWSRDKDELLADVTSRLLSSTDVQSIIENIALRTMRFLNCDVFFNYLTDEEKGGITLNAYAGVPEEEATKMKHLDLGVAVCGRVAQGGKRIVVGDIMTSEDERTPFLKSQEVQAYACHPLLVHGKTIGTLSFGTKSKARFSDDELSVMKEVSNHIAIAMQRLVEGKALAESEEKYRSLFKNIKETVTLRQLVFDQNGSIVDSIIIDANPSTLEAWGYSSIDEVKGKKTTKLFSEEVTEDHLANVREAMSLSGPITKEVSFNERTYLSTFVPLGDNLIIVSSADVTDLKKTETDLKRSNEELRQFAYVASHDLQEPLRMVSTYLGLLERRHGDKLDGSAKEYMDFAVQGAERMRELINDLLAFSRLDTQAKPFVSVDMNGVVKKAVENLRAFIESHQAQVTFDKLPTINADDGQMVQLMQNLIGNAIKFHSVELPEVRISSRENWREYIFSVKDNGIGIASEYQEKIFEMFQRLHTREEYEGTGIGLAISKRIVERHGGRIWVESDGKNGSTFNFTIPKRGHSS